MHRFLKNICTFLGRVDEKWKYVAVGVAISTTSLWLGAFIMQFADDAWWGFPMFITAFMAVAAGYIVALYSIIEL